MLTSDVRFEGWTTEDWLRLLRLFQPRSDVPTDTSRARGVLVVVHEDGVARKVLHTRKGRLNLKRFDWPVPIETLPETHDASLVLVLQVGALEELMERFGARVRRTDDLTAQFLTLMGAIGELIDEGRIDRFPRRLEGVPLPAPSVVHRALDTICPDHRTMVIGTYREGELSTALILRRRGRGFDVVAGPEAVRPRIGLVSGDWRRDHTHLAEAVAERYGALGFGCFADEVTFERLLRDGRAGTWSKAAAVRDVIFSPMPTAIGIALGLDGVRLAASGLRVVTDRLDALGVLSPLTERFRKRFGSAAGDRDVSRVLGFDPMEALRALLRR